MISVPWGTRHFLSSSHLESCMIIIPQSPFHWWVRPDFHPISHLAFYPSVTSLLLQLLASAVSSGSSPDTLVLLILSLPSFGCLQISQGFYFTDQQVSASGLCVLFLLLRARIVIAFCLLISPKSKKKIYICIYKKASMGCKKFSYKPGVEIRGKRARHCP